MARPQRFRNKWRLRWLDEHGKRRSKCFETKTEADKFALLVQAEVARIKMGERIARPEQRTCEDLFRYWLEKRAGGSGATRVLDHSICRVIIA